jgi:hypothetical protein
MWVPTASMEPPYKIIQPKRFFLAKNHPRLHLKRFCWLKRRLAAWSVGIRPELGNRT